MHWKRKIHLTCFVVRYTLLWWSETEPAISPGYVCREMVKGPLCSLKTDGKPIKGGWVPVRKDPASW